MNGQRGISFLPTQQNLTLTPFWGPLLHFARRYLSLHQPLNVDPSKGRWTRRLEASQYGWWLF